MVTHGPPPDNQVPGPTNLDEFINGPEFGSGDYVEDIDLEAGRNSKWRKLIHHASRRITGRAAADQQLIVSLSNELESAMRQLQESNVALNICQRSKKDIMKMRASSRSRRTEYVRQQWERIEEQERVLSETTAAWKSGRRWCMTSRNSMT
jgi:hypothetical protein